MKLARVIGRITLSKKDEALAGIRLIIASPLDKSQMTGENSSQLSVNKSNLIVCDCFGAAMGDIIGYVEGAEATAPFDSPTPVDAYNVGLVENLRYIPDAK